MKFYVGCPNGHLLWLDRSGSRVLSADVFERLVDRLVSRFKFQRVSGQGNFVSERPWQKVPFFSACLDSLLMCTDRHG
jgi:hypothetical protein